MKNDEDSRITICTAPPGLYAVVKDAERPPDSDMLHTIHVVTAFKYTHYGGAAKEIYSEPLVYCESKDTNALVDGRSKIEFVGSLENCVLKVKELISAHYAKKNAGRNQL